MCQMAQKRWFRDVALDVVGRARGCAAQLLGQSSLSETLYESRSVSQEDRIVRGHLPLPLGDGPGFGLPERQITLEHVAGLRFMPSQ
jgi:hypothetical protein